MFISHSTHLSTYVPDDGDPANLVVEHGLRIFVRLALEQHHVQEISDPEKKTVLDLFQEGRGSNAVISNFCL